MARMWCRSPRPARRLDLRARRHHGGPRLAKRIANAAPPRHAGPAPMAEEEDDETLIAARMPGYPGHAARGAPPAHGPHDDDLPDEDATLLAIPRAHVAHAQHAAQHPQPRPAAGLPPPAHPVFAQPRPAAGLPPPQAFPQPRPAAGFPAATPPPPRPPPAAMPAPQPSPGFVPVDRTMEMPMVTWPAGSPGVPPAPPPPTAVHVPPGMPQPRQGLPPPPSFPGGPRPGATPQPAQSISHPAPQHAPLPTPPPPAPLPPAVAAPPAPPEAQHEGMPSLVVRWLLVCGLLTVLGLSALIYLQL